MSGHQHQMFWIVDHLFFALCGTSPEDEDHRAVLPGEHFDCRVRELLPADFLVGICLMRTHSQHRVQHQNTLPCPFFEIAVVRDVASQIVFEFLINVDQGRRNVYFRFYRKAESVCLSRLVVRVLA